ncbi:hypothetical protein, partial [Wolbachia pipientis]|uniref:hypothetical protein n=1 Tax=Wolbachia pipientis TaxID=955 RepID=UPI00202F59C5
KKTGKEIRIVHYLISDKIYKTTADNEEVKSLNNLSLLHKLAHYLLTYYCYGNEENGKLAAEFLHINSLNKECALALLIQVINSYSSYIEKEFQPEKDFYEKITEMQMEFFKTMKGLCDEFCKNLGQYHEQFFKTDLELHKENLEIHKQIHKQNSEFYQLASGFLARRLERKEANIAQMDEMLNEKVHKGINDEQQCQPNCSQQQPATQVCGQPGPSCELDDVPPISRVHSFHSGYSGSSNL